eukprot:290701-Prymnesium_polylepis.1
MSSWFDAPELAPWLPEIERRRRIIDQARAGIAATDGSLHDFCFANGIHFYGLQRQQADRAQKGGFWFREWAPTARAASLVGDFNGWDADAHPCARDEAGVFSVFVPDPADGVPALPLGTGYKIALRVQGDGGDWVFRVPAWARLTRQDPLTGDVCAVVVGEIEGFAWRHARPAAPPSLRIYEAHVGIGSEEAAVATWGEFRRCVLPHVVALGYNALLLMAVHQHGYYASFGYQVLGFAIPTLAPPGPKEVPVVLPTWPGRRAFSLTLGRRAGDVLLRALVALRPAVRAAGAHRRGPRPRRHRVDGPREGRRPPTSNRAAGAIPRCRRALGPTATRRATAERWAHGRTAPYAAPRPALGSTYTRLPATRRGATLPRGPPVGGRSTPTRHATRARASADWAPPTATTLPFLRAEPRGSTPCGARGSLTTAASRCSASSSPTSAGLRPR